MISQALYADIRQDESTKACDEDRYKEDLKGSRNLAAPEEASQPDKDCPTTCKTEDEHKSETTPDQDYDKMVDDLTNEARETVRVNLTKAYAADAKSSNCKQVIMPYSLSLTFDGIGGFKFGQAITCNLLPKRVKDRFTYQVTAVEHSVSYGDWTTTVKAIGRYRS